MIPILLSVVSALGAPQVVAAMSGPCGGPDMAIVSVVKSQPMTNASQVNVYHVSVTLGTSAARASRATRSTRSRCTCATRKPTSKGSNRSRSARRRRSSSRSARSADAGMGTTNLHFVMQYTQPATPDCNPTNDAMNARL